MLIIILLYSFNIAEAQVEKSSYRFSFDIEKSIEKDTVNWKYQLGAFEYSFAGNYKRARQTWDKQGVRPPVVSKEDSTFFSNFRPVHAKDYVMERSKKEQLIIINEAHAHSNHRTFVNSLLQGLYDHGYRYLGLEALYDEAINERKFPTAESGYYTKDPEFGNLIYAALRTGYTIFGYDDPDHNGKEREMNQAKNIVNFINKHPKSKILIFCGHDHVIEGTPNISAWGKAMAGRVKEYTQMDPFTIDQVLVSEKSDKINNHPFISMVDKTFPVMMVDERGNLFNGKKGSDQVDCVIIHPATQYINGRPDWLLNIEGRREIYLDRSSIVEYPLIVLAYRKNEFTGNGVPSDIIEILDTKNIPPLILGKGEYELIMKDKDYRILNRQEIRIE